MTARRACIYCRISADREGRELGVERQEEDCRTLAERLALDVVDVRIDNDISASTRSKKPRPEYDRLLADARAGHYDVILAYTSGRLTRRPREHEDLIELAEQHGIEFDYVKSPSFDLNTSAGRRVARILAATDAGEAEDIQERVVRAKAQMAADGEWRGGRRPFGYEADGVTVNEDEACVVRQVAADLLAGMSLNAVTKGLNERGIVTSMGGPWRPREVSRAVTRARNAALIEHDNQIVGPAQWAPILDEGVWRSVAALLGDPARRRSPPPGRRWLLSGIATCGVCGSAVNCRSVRNGAKKAARWTVYACKADQHVNLQTGGVDDLVVGRVLARLTRPDAAELLRVDHAVDTAELHRRGVGIRGRLDELAGLFAREVIDGRQMELGTAELREEQAAIAEQLAAASRRSVFHGLVGVPNVAAAWGSLPLDRRRAIVSALVTVVLLRSPRGRPAGWRPGESYFRPGSVQIELRQ